jgi:predicted ATPase
MRIAISGSHRTGKSTLLEELAASLPGYETVEEPYHLLEEDGHEFSHPPSIEDLEAQLERAIQELSEAGETVLLDRCPIDILAYLAVHEDGDEADWEAWLPRVREAVEALDWVVFVPIEAPDRISFADADDEGGTRAAVEAKLREFLLEDPFELGLQVIEVRGDIESRARAVLKQLRLSPR